MTVRADNIGSLLRPAFLKQAQRDLASGRLGAAEFKAIEDRAVDTAIAMQEGVGLDVVTDGEFRRQTFFDQLRGAVDGLREVDDPPVHFTFHADEATQDVPYDGTSSTAAFVVVEKLKRRRMVSVEEFSYARGRARVPVKVTLPSPLMLFQMWSREASSDAYADPFDLFLDGAALVREEASELAALGCQYIQIDAPELGQLVDPECREIWERLGVPPERALSEGIDIINSCADVPGVRFGIHLCRGNFRSRWLAQGGYGDVAKQVFARATNFDTYLLEYDDERSGGFEPLADLPGDKLAVLGLVSTKRAAVESADELRSRIDQACEHASREQLALSTQCGFASIDVGNELGEDAQAAKLKLVADVAADVWG